MEWPLWGHDGCKVALKSVRTRFGRSRIAHAATLMAVLAVTPFLPAPALLAQDTAAAPADAAAGSQVLCEPQVINWRRIPKESILARLSIHQGDPYDPAAVERDFNLLWNTGFFETVRAFSW
jgi:outer membrane protein insertion porin family